MTKNSNDNMLGISVAVLRSNPLILRYVHITPASTLASLIALCRISLGISSDGEDEIFVNTAENEAEELVTDKTAVCESVLKKGDSVRLLLRDENHRHQLTLLLDIREVPCNPDSAETPIPYVSEAIGLNLPEGIYDISKINHLQAMLLKYDLPQRENDKYYTLKELTFSPKRTENAIKRYFAPGSAGREINRNLGIPMAALLGSITNNELKDILDMHRLYRDSSMRKVHLVEKLCSFYTERNTCYEVLNEMDVQEYLDFQKFITSPTDEVKGDYLEKLDYLYSMGLINDVPKVGIRIPLEMIDYYEELEETGKIEKLLWQKYLNMAFLCCRNLYGIFTYEMFKSVLQVIAPEDVPTDLAEKLFSIKYYPSFVPSSSVWQNPFSTDKEFHEFTEEKRALIISNRLDILSDGVLYYMEVFRSATNARKLYSKLCHEEGVWYVPTKEEAVSWSRDGSLLSSDGSNKLRELYRQFRGYYYNNQTSLLQKISGILHMDGDVKKAAAAVENELYEIRWSTNRQNVLEEITKCLEKEALRIPLIIRNGYSKSNTPEIVLEHEKKEKLKEKEAAKKEAAKKTAKKAAARPVKRR